MALFHVCQSCPYLAPLSLDPIFPDSLSKACGPVFALLQHPSGSRYSLLGAHSNGGNTGPTTVSHAFAWFPFSATIRGQFPKVHTLFSDTSSSSSCPASSPRARPQLCCHQDPRQLTFHEDRAFQRSPGLCRLYPPTLGVPSWSLGLLLQAPTSSVKRGDTVPK